VWHWPCHATHESKGCDTKGSPYLLTDREAAFAVAIVADTPTGAIPRLLAGCG